MLTIPVYWCQTEFNRGEFSYRRPDTLVDFATQHRMAIRGHPLVYQLCLPSWLEQGVFSRAQIVKMLKDHVQAIVRRYRGRVETWDVVNEALSWKASPQDSLMLWGTVPVNRNFFSEAIGPEYVEMAFRWAHEADPNAKLYYNDYGTEGETAKAEHLYRLVQGLLERGVPIHGVGFQTHASIFNPPNEDAFATTLARIADLGVDVQITEMDVDVNEKARGTALPLPTEPELSRRLDLQADVYVSAMRACLSVPRCTGLTTWGVSDAHTWLEWHQNPNEVQRAPLLFDIDYSPKVAYGAMHDVLSDSPRR